MNDFGSKVFKIKTDFVIDKSFVAFIKITRFVKPIKSTNCFRFHRNVSFLKYLSNLKKKPSLVINV